MRYVGLECLLGSFERGHNSLPVAVQNDQIPLIVHFADLVRNPGHCGRHLGYFVAPIPERPKVIRNRLSDLVEALFRLGWGRGRRLSFPLFSLSLSQICLWRRGERAGVRVDLTAHHVRRSTGGGCRLSPANSRLRRGRRRDLLGPALTLVEGLILLRISIFRRLRGTGRRGHFVGLSILADSFAGANRWHVTP